MSTHNIHLKYRTEKISCNFLHCASWCGTISNFPRLELPPSRTDFHGLKGVRAIRVQLYSHVADQVSFLFSGSETCVAYCYSPYIVKKGGAIAIKGYI